MNPIDITQFLGLRNTVDEARQPLGALTHATNVLIDDSGAIIRRKGSFKIAHGKITGSYGTRDKSAMYLVDDGSLYRFNGESFTLLCDGMGHDTVHWCEESSSLIFVQTEQRFIAVKNGFEIIDLSLPIVSDAAVMVKVGKLPAMSLGLCAQYVNIKTGLRGALCKHQIVDIPDGSSLSITVPFKDGFYVAIYGFFPNSGAWSLIDETESESLIRYYPNTSEPADDVYFNTTAIPKEVVAMTYHLGRIAIATIQSDKSTLIQFSVPNFYHLFDTIHERFEIPDLITGMMSVNEQLLITGMNSIHVFAEGRLQKIADFGTPVGRPIELLPTGGVLIWTYRGVCQFPEFKNLTENNFSVSAGFGCATSLYEHDGSKYLIIATDDAGQAFNASFSV